MISRSATILLMVIRGTSTTQYYTHHLLPDPGLFQQIPIPMPEPRLFLHHTQQQLAPFLLSPERQLAAASSAKAAKAEAALVG